MRRPAPEPRVAPELRVGGRGAPPHEGPGQVVALRPAGATLEPGTPARLRCKTPAAEAASGASVGVAARLRARCAWAPGGGCVGSARASDLADADFETKPARRDASSLAPPKDSLFSHGRGTCPRARTGEQAQAFAGRTGRPDATPRLACEASPPAPRSSHQQSPSWLTSLLLATGALPVARRRAPRGRGGARVGVAPL